VSNHAAIQAFHVYLFEQIAMGHSSIIEDLVSSGIPADLADDSDTADTTLHWAVSFNNIDAAQLLLNLGVPVDILNNQGKSCLHLACQNANRLFIELLLNWGADITLEDDSGKVPGDYLKNDKTDLHDLLDSPVNDVQTSPIKLKNDRGAEDTEEVYDERCCRNEGGDESESAVSPRDTSNNVNSTGSYVVLEKGSQSPEVSLSNSRESNDIFTDIKSDYNDDATGSSASDTLPYSSSSSSSSDYSVNSTNEESSHLILWPPAQRQYQYNTERPYEVNLDRPLVISCDEDFSNILSNSRLVNTLNGVGVQTDINYSGCHGGSDLWLCIDKNICPVLHSFELHVESQAIRLIGADEAGLLYAINTLVQVLKLHSDYITKPPTPGSESDTLIVNFIKIPSMTIHDWPDVTNRAIMWSHSREIRSNVEHMKDFIMFISEVRINQVFMRIDCDDNFCQDSSNVEQIGDTKDKVTMNMDDYHLDLISIDELTHQYFIDFIPTIVITSMEQNVPSVVLKRNFISTTVTVILKVEIKTDTTESQTIFQQASSFVYQIFKNLVAAGYKSIILSCCDTLLKGMRESPARIAVKLGLNTVNYPLEVFFPKVSLSRSLMSTKSLAKPFLRNTKQLLKRKQNSLILLPAMGISDFYYPIILLKHLCFLHAGAAWNHESLEDILGDGLDDHTMLRPALSTLLFQTYNPSDADVDNLEELFQNAMLDVFTNSSDEYGMIEMTTSCSSHSQLNEQCSQGSPKTGGCRSPMDIDGAIWGTVCASRTKSIVKTPVTKEEAVITLKRTKRILSSVNWRVVDSKNKDLTSLSSNISMIETEEYMRMLHLVNVLCRTLILSFNSTQKPTLPYRPALPSTHLSDLSMVDIIDSLSPGTSSDLANAILEAMTLCSWIWRMRLDAQYHASGSEQVHDTCLEMSELLVERYVFIQRAELPLLAIFGSICRHMPSFSPDVLMKIFEDGEEVVLTAKSQEPVASRWSLWG
jgi:hypothetical protein